MEYGITNVDHEGDLKGDEHIAKVRVYSKSILDEEWKDPKPVCVEDVIEDIKLNNSYYITLFKEKGEFREGAKVKLKEFITTEPNDIVEDNLGSLPPMSGIWD